MVFQLNQSEPLSQVSHTHIIIFTPLTVYFPATVAPSVELVPDIAVADVGGEVNLMCNVQGGPNNIFMWKKDSGLLENETTNTLQLTNVAVSDAGVYTCTVSNAAGDGSDYTQLYIAPNIITAPENETASVYESVIFSCVAEGAPVPDIVWEYEGPPSTEESSSSASGSASSSTSGSSDTSVPGEVNTTVNGSTVTSMLTINPVQYNNYGVYRCVANSSSLMRSTSAEAVLHGKTHTAFLHCSLYLLSHPVSPSGSVAISPAGVDAMERGINHTLTCMAQGGPGNTVSWIKLGQTGTLSESPELIITISDASVGGTYQCTVENIAGSDSASAVINGEPVLSRLF